MYYKRHVRSDCVEQTQFKKEGTVNWRRLIATLALVATAFTAPTGCTSKDNPDPTSSSKSTDSSDPRVRELEELGFKDVKKNNTTGYYMARLGHCPVFLKWQEGWFLEADLETGDTIEIPNPTIEKLSKDSRFQSCFDPA